MGLKDGPLIQKIGLWRSGTSGLKSRLTNKAKDPVLDRDDVPEVFTQDSIRRGDFLQSARLKRYPSIDVDMDRVYAGTFGGSLSEVESRLVRLGGRNNPTAYVEVTEENGPDDGSYSILQITESGGRTDLPRVRNQPSFLRRVKDQLHVVLWKNGDQVDIGCHREQHPWLQPMRHVAINDSNARVGVRDFRDIWYDEFGEELGGKESVKWETTH